MAGLPYEVKFSGPQRDIDLAGLPYEVTFSGEEKRRQRGGRKKRMEGVSRTAQVKSRDPHQTWWGINKKALNSKQKPVTKRP